MNQTVRQPPTITAMAPPKDTSMSDTSSAKKADRLFFQKLDLDITVSHICGEKIEQCCNYKITGKGPLTLHLPPVTNRMMSHMRDNAFDRPVEK